MTVMDQHIEEESDYSDDGVLDSDEELQKAFARGELQSGTYKEITPKVRLINDISGLETKLTQLSHASLDWLERLDVTVKPTATEDDDEEEKIQDDFKRELNFYRMAENAVKQAIPKLHKLGVPTKRPEDYFAQMIKSDDHMRKVRQVLLSKSMSAEKSEKAKKMRELKKMGKKVQVEVMKSRQKDKRDMIEQVKRYRKGQQDRLDFLNDDEQPNKGKPKSQTSKTTTANRSNKKRDWKNKKFGFGGQKKRSKSNTKDSYNQSRDYSVNRNSKAPKKGGKAQSKNARPGKSKRQQMKGKK